MTTVNCRYVNGIGWRKKAGGRYKRKKIADETNSIGKFFVR